MISPTRVFLVAFLGFFPAVRCDMKCPGIAEYELSFYGMWSNMTHPNAVPAPQGKFSPWVGASHNMYYKMWDEGMLASKGVQQVAESGNSSVLQTEIKQRIMYNKTAWKLILQSGGPTNGTAHAMGISVEVTADYPMVSLVSMIAPSPDWFTGIKGVNLCHNGMWRDSWNVTMLHPWDAGTDDGTMFGSQDAVSNPQQNITMITKDSDTPFMGLNAIATLGKLMFKRVNKPTVHSCSSSEQKYTLKFEGTWSNARQPQGYPSGAHFSKLIGCTHKYNYKFWSPMTMASAGVKNVAETGNPDTLYNELDAVKSKGGYVYKVFKAPDTTPGTGTTEIEIMVKGMYSMVSVISMLAPSPDWFVGVPSYDLCGSNGWKDDGMMVLHAWDAGTKDDKNFTMGTMDTMPKDVIRQITKDSDTVLKGAVIPAFAKITFTRVITTDKPTTPDSAHSPSSSFSVFLSVAFLVILRFLY